MGGGMPYNSSIHKKEAPKTADVLRNSDKVLSGMADIDPLVDPRIRNNEREFRDLVGQKPAMGTRLALDQTGSMRKLPAQILERLPQLHRLLTEQDGVNYLSKYHPQMAFAAFGDPRYNPDCTRDKRPYTHTQYESSNAMDKQIGKLVLEGRGGDTPEGQLFDIYYTLYHTVGDTWNHGVKPYDFIVSDVMGFDELTTDEIDYVLGRGAARINSTVSAKTLVSQLLKKWHAFFLQLEGSEETTKYWTKLLGPARVVSVDSVEHLNYTSAAIIGLTEGVVTVEDVYTDLLRVGLDTHAARRIVKSVAHIPIGAQMAEPGYAKIYGLTETSVDSVADEEKPKRKREELSADDELPDWMPDDAHIIDEEDDDTGDHLKW